ncbi:coiled-coil domain-containing protein 57 [Phyllostomus discolor]|uniref:Coiled-coil domain-containing protein 57 n=1 Tax=Phyllostomus discolor TaxID=89673 RepID=A0A7E6CD99_9CHIR|nr:coiled-coil domain-containing protein 57 [Phyllostomus discolor]
MPPPPSEQALGELLARKEEEWRALQAQRARLQEAALQEAQGRLEEAQGRLRRLQEDFVYNLQVLEERDRELERYDAAFAQAQRLEGARQAEVSELKVEAARLRQALAREAQRREELQQQLQQKEQEHRLALRRAHSDKSGEVDRQREQYEKLQRTLERKLEELDGQLALQRQELLLEFESETQKREQAFRLHADSVSGVVLAHELKVKLLNEELGALKEAGAQAAESLRSAQAANSELEDRLRRAAWELRDLAAVKDARIKELEGRLQSTQLTREKEEETFRRKHEELDRTARERDAVLASVKDAHAEQLRALEARVRELQAQCEALELQARRAEWRQADALREKDAAIARLREEASTLRSDWDAQVAQLSKEMTSRDLRVQSLQQEEAELQAQLARCQQDVGRYQRQLALAAEREQSLERDKAQLGLDWQRRCAGLERDHYRQSEELVQGLTAAREQAVAKLQEAERKLREQEAVLRAVTLERDQALQALRTHGLLPEQELQVLLGRRGEEAGGSFPSGEIQRLQRQNASLRDAVARMRTQMEALSQQVLPPTQPAGGGASAPTPQPESGAQAATPDYVLGLEAEIRNLKCKLETLEEQLGDVPQSDGPPGLPPAAEATGLPTGDAAAPDSVAVGLALGRLGDRTRLLNLLVARLRQEVRPPQAVRVCDREWSPLPPTLSLMSSSGPVFLRLFPAPPGLHLGGFSPRSVRMPPSRLYPRRSPARADGRAGPLGPVWGGWRAVARVPRVEHLKQMRGGPEGRVSLLIFRNLPPPPPAALSPSPIHGGCLLPNAASDGPQALQEPRKVGATQCALPHTADQVQLEALELQGQVAELQRHLGTAGPSRCVALGRQVGALRRPRVHPSCWPSWVLLQGSPWGLPSQWPAEPGALLQGRGGLLLPAFSTCPSEGPVAPVSFSVAEAGPPVQEAGPPPGLLLAPLPPAVQPGQAAFPLLRTPCDVPPETSVSPEVTSGDLLVRDGEMLPGRPSAGEGEGGGAGPGPGRHHPRPLPHPCGFPFQVLAAGGPSGTGDPGAPPPLAPSVPQLQRKLRAAAQAALRLQREKEQLLELGNRLRARLGRPAGTPGRPCPGPGARNPGEGPETTWEHGRPLRQLQPHLASQGSRSADGGRPGEAPPHAAAAVGRDGAPHGTAAGTAGPGQKRPSVSTATCKSAREKENRSPEPRQAPGPRQGRGPHTPRSSSLTSGSLQDTWRLLDLGSSPSGLASQDDPAPAELTAPAAADRLRPANGSPRETRAAFAIQGVKMDAQAKAKPARPPRAHPANPKRCQRAPKIRNYNVKD